MLPRSKFNISHDCSLCGLPKSIVSECGVGQTMSEIKCSLISHIFILTRTFDIFVVANVLKVYCLMVHEKKSSSAMVKNKSRGKNVYIFNI